MALGSSQSGRSKKGRQGEKEIARAQWKLVFCNLVSQKGCPIISTVLYSLWVSKSSPHPKGEDCKGSEYQEAGIVDVCLRGCLTNQVTLPSSRGFLAFLCFYLISQHLTLVWLFLPWCPILPHLPLTLCWFKKAHLLLFKRKPNNMILSHSKFFCS